MAANRTRWHRQIGHSAAELGWKVAEVTRLILSWSNFYEVRVRRFWFWFRVALFSVVFVGLGLYLYEMTSWRRWVFGLPTYKTEIAEGNVWVDRVLAFRARTGLWPQYVEDAAPAGVAAERKWFYELRAAGSEGKAWPALSMALPEEGSRAHLGFDFDPREGKWRVFGGAEERVVEARRVVAGASTMPGEETVRELDRRIAREGSVAEHWMGKAAVLLKMGRDAEARKVVEEAARAMPGSDWPRLARAALDGTAESAAAFEAWAREKPTMTRGFYVWWLWRRAGQKEKAMAGIEMALGQPVEVGADDTRVAEFYLWEMGRWCVREQEWVMAVRIAEAWEAAAKDGRTKEGSFVALKGAGLLGQGKVAAAREVLATVDKPERLWAKGVDGLKAAAAKGDVGYRWEPGEVPAGYEVFALPE